MTAKTRTSKIKSASVKNKPAETSPKKTKKSLISLRRQKTVKRETDRKLTGSFRLFRDSASFARQYWKVLGGITLVYFLLTVFLVGFGANASLGDVKAELEQSTGGSAGGLGVNVALFARLVGTAGTSPTESGSAYRLVFAIVVSLAVIWTLRQRMSGHPVTVRDAFYKGVYPLVPATIVLFFIGLQLIPLMIGAFFFGVMISAGLANTPTEQLLSGAIAFLLMLLSLYFVTSSIFAFYIVTLPDMRPMKALRSARGLVRHRRWTVMRKLVFLPFALLVILAVISMPVIWLWTGLAMWLFVFLSLGALVFAHIYIYSLYKELL